MNKKLTALANKLESVSVILLLFSALRSDGGLPFWLPIALSGILTNLTYAKVPKKPVPAKKEEESNEGLEE